MLYHSPYYSCSKCNYYGCIVILDPPGADLGFSERRSECLKKGVWSVASEAIVVCICILKIPMSYTLTIAMYVAIFLIKSVHVYNM